MVWHLIVMSKFHHYSYRNISAYYVDSVGFREVRDFLKDRDEQVIDDSLTACANGAKHVTETEHLGTSRGGCLFVSLDFNVPFNVPTDMAY